MEVIVGIVAPSRLRVLGGVFVKIESVVLREIRMPLLQPFETSFGRTTERRILLVEVQSEGVTGWGECTAGEHPSFSGECTDTAWLILTNELIPALLHAEIDSALACAPRR